MDHRGKQRLVGTAALKQARQRQERFAVLAVQPLDHAILAELFDQIPQFPVPVCQDRQDLRSFFTVAQAVIIGIFFLKRRGPIF